MLASQHQCSPLSTSARLSAPASARLSAPVLASRHQCWPLGTSAGLSAPVLASRHQCWPLGTSAGLSAPVLASRHQCWPLGTSAGLSAPVLASRHQCWPLGTSAGLSAHQSSSRFPIDHRILVKSVFNNLGSFSVPDKFRSSVIMDLCSTRSILSHWPVAESVVTLLTPPPPPPPPPHLSRCGITIISPFHAIQCCMLVQTHVYVDCVSDVIEPVMN